MQIQGSAMACTLESNDVMVTVSPAQALEVQVTSIVLGQFGEELKRVALGAFIPHLRIVSRFPSETGSALKLLAE